MGLTLTLSFHCGPLFRALPPLGALEPSYTGDDTGEPAVHGGLSDACQPPSPQASSGAFLSPQLSSEVAADAGVQTELLLCSLPPPPPPVPRPALAALPEGCPWWPLLALLVPEPCERPSAQWALLCPSRTRALGLLRKPSACGEGPPQCWHLLAPQSCHSSHFESPAGSTPTDPGGWNSHSGCWACCGCDGGGGWRGGSGWGSLS